MCSSSKNEKYPEKQYDLTFIGQLCRDESLHPGQEASVAMGGAAVYGAVAAARSGKRVAAVLMGAPQEQQEAGFLKNDGIDIFPIDSDQTTSVQVIHTSSNMDERRVITQAFAGQFEEKMVPELNSKYVHLAGCNDHEFSLDFIRAMKKRGYCLSVDMQCFVRYNDPETGEMNFKDDANKKDVISLMDKIKLDILEATLLTGSDDLEEASAIIQSWGCPEVVITRADGVLVRFDETVFFTKFNNQGVLGRTGRGDTTFGAYLARRVDYSPEESLRFAAALVSIKMETPGPFTGSLDDVIKRMEM